MYFIERSFSIFNDCSFVCLLVMDKYCGELEHIKIILSILCDDFFTNDVPSREHSNYIIILYVHFNVWYTIFNNLLKDRIIKYNCFFFKLFSKDNKVQCYKQSIESKHVNYIKYLVLPIDHWSWPYSNRQPTLWLYDLCREVLTVQW